MVTYQNVLVIEESGIHFEIDTMWKRKYVFEVSSGACLHFKTFWQLQKNIMKLPKRFQMYLYDEIVKMGNN